MGAAWTSGLKAGGQKKSDAKKSIALKVLLPQADATLTVNKTKIKGEGEERLVKVAPKGDAITVTTMWEPNNYTKITRTRKLTVKGGAELVVDLRKGDPKQPDDIVVRFVPTPDDVVEGMCKLAKVTKEDIVYDLGCGDGRMVITAVKQFGAKRGVGIDLDPKLVKECKEKAQSAGVEKRVEFRQGDVLKVDDLSDATVVLLYMGDDINNRLRPILQKTLKPGARIVSHRFTMGDWKPSKTETINSSAGYECQIHLWEIKGTDKK
jgi:SAM-dependent methyltransferase